MVLVKLDPENWTLPTDRIDPSPSFLDGVDLRLETDLRIFGCSIIRDVGIAMEFPQVAIASAQVLFQRIYYTKNYSFKKHKMDVTALAALFLASKVEECPEPCKKLIHKFIKVWRKKLTPNSSGEHAQNVHSRTKDNQQTCASSQEIQDLLREIYDIELMILKNLGFCLRTNYPHKLIVNYLQFILLPPPNQKDIGDDKPWTKRENIKLLQVAWNYMNDSLMTNIFVRHSSEVIACACIHLAARILRRPLAESEGHEWYRLFNVGPKEVLDVCNCILRLYIRPKPDIRLLIPYLRWNPLASRRE